MKGHMASLDTLLGHMSASGATGALLRGDAPIQLQTPRGPGQLGVVAGAQLERDIREIAPPEALAQLSATGSAQFSYGGAQFAAQNVGGVWQLQITAPAAYANAIATEPNTSGQGASAEVPPAIRGWNWGAFFLPWIWGIGNNSWIGLLALVPCLGFFARFLMGAKGNQWSWQKRRWNSLADFQNAQRTWPIVGAVVFIGGNLVALPITSAILFPVFARARENARRASCQSNLKQISLAVLQYSTSHNDILPKGTTFAQWKTQLAPDLPTAPAGSNGITHCPSDTSPNADSYQLNPKLSGVSLDALSNPATTPMMWDKSTIEHLDGRNVAFADGHIKWYRDEVFQSQIAPLTQ